MAEQERRALAAVQQGQPVDCQPDHYFARIRSALQDYAGQMIDGGQNVRAVIALEEVRRLDKLFRTGDHMKELDNAERGSYGRPSSAEWKPDEGAPTPQSLGHTAE